MSRITDFKWIRKNGKCCHNHGIIAERLFQTSRSIMLFKLKQKTPFPFFFLRPESCHSPPLTRLQNKLALSPPGHRPWVGGPTLARISKRYSLCSLNSLRPTSSLQAPPLPDAPAQGRTRGCRGARAAMAAGGGGVADPLSPAGVPCAFSPQSQAYFALASADGHLRVWETANNRLHQEYVPSAHLSGTCTCLAWAPARLQAKVK